MFLDCRVSRVRVGDALGSRITNMLNFMEFFELLNQPYAGVIECFAL